MTISSLLLLYLALCVLGLLLAIAKKLVKLALTAAILGAVGVAALGGLTMLIGLI